jgi:hypothetical protein
MPTPANDQNRLRLNYNALRDEHERLNRDIAALEEQGTGIDRLALQRLKKRKLQLKDRISELQRWLVPDIIA